MKAAVDVAHAMGKKIAIHSYGLEGARDAVLDLTITDAKRDVPANIQIPPAQNNNLNRVGIEQPDPGVYFLTGTHNSVAAGFDSYVVVIEAPLNEARSKAVIAQVRRLFPGLPIRYVVNTHQHTDHVGGLRTYSARGATILAGRINRAYYPNISIADTIHPDEMLMSYFPHEKIVIEADVYTAGPRSVASPVVVNPCAAALVDNLQRLKLGLRDPSWVCMAVKLRK